MRRLLFLAFPVLLLFSCKKDTPDARILDAYIEENSDWGTSDKLIACAAGGEFFPADVSETMVYIFFYPQAIAYDFKYFETDNANVNENDLGNYTEMQLPERSVFNGYLRRFERVNPSQDRWAIITYRLHDTLWRCQPIKLKGESNPTIVDHEIVEIDVSVDLKPTFSWTDEAENNAIYFQVISDLDGNLLTGTYTFDTDFSFYQPEEFAPNITDEELEPVLVSGESYLFTLMGVGEDNWVNLISEMEFVAE